MFNKSKRVPSIHCFCRHVNQKKSIENPHYRQAKKGKVEQLKKVAIAVLTRFHKKSVKRKPPNKKSKLYGARHGQELKNEKKVRCQRH